MRASRKTLALAAASLVILTICAVLPGILRTEPQTPPPRTALKLTDAKRTEYYVGSQNSLGEFLENNPPQASLARAEEIISDFFNLVLIEDSENWEVKEEAVNHYNIGCGDYGALRIMERYLEWSGNWRNWFIIRLDADTGLVYYFYASSAPIVRASGREGRVPADVYEFLSQFESITGLELLNVRGAESEAYEYEARFLSAGEVVRYDISYRNYPSRMMDIKMTIIQ